MSNALFTAIAWLGLAAHVAVAIAARRRGADLRLVAGINLVVALCVVGYWATRWYAYVAGGVQWSMTDQLFPLFALLVAVLATGTLAGWWALPWLHWTVLAIDGLVFLAAVLFASLFRMKMF